MAKYQTKSVIVDAVQFNPQEQWPEFIHRHPQNRPVPMDGSLAYFYTPAEGKVSVMAGDWIITDASGKRSICKPDVFETAYEPVEVI